AAEGGERRGECFLGGQILTEPQAREPEVDLGPRQIGVLGSAAQELVREVRVAGGGAVLAIFGEKEGKAPGEASRPQRVAQRAQGLVRGAQVQHGTVEVAPTTQTIRELVEQANSADRVNGVQLRQRRAVVIDRLARVVCCLTQVTEFLETARR